MAAAARDHPLAEPPAIIIGARRLTVQRAVDLLDVEGVDCPLPGAPRWRRARRRRADSSIRRSTPPRRRGRTASARAAASRAASGSSSSRAAPGEDQRAPRAASARAIACPRPPVAPVSEHAAARRGPCGARAYANTATVAVKACRKCSPPTGPISPAAKNPAAGAPRELLGDRLGVVVGGAEHARGRGRCRRTRARRPARGRRAPPCGRPAPRAGRGRRSPRRGRAGGRPGPGARRPRRRPCPSPDPRPPGRGRGSRPGTYSGLLPSTTIPISSPPCTSSRSSAGSVSIVSRSFSSAGLPASSSMMLPSAAVIVSSGPIGAAPWDTHGSISTPSSRTPDRALLEHVDRRGTAPRRRRAGARRRGRRAAAASACDSDRKRSTASVGKLAGSASRIAPSAPARSGMPVSAPAPSSSSSTEAWNAEAVPSPRCAAHTETAVPSSTSSSEPITPPAPQPISSSGSSASWTASSVVSGAARCAPDGEHERQVAARPRKPGASERSGLERALARVGGDREAGADCGRPSVRRYPRGPAQRGILPRRGDRASSGRRGSARRRSAIALAERLRAEGEDPVAVSADALQLYARPRDPDGRADRRGAGAAGAPARRRSCRSPRAHRGRVRAPRPRGDRRAAGGRAPADRRRRHRPVPPRRAGRAGPAPARGAGAPRAPPPRARSPRGARAARRAAARAPAAAAAIRPARRAARRARARAARRGPRAAGGGGRPRCGRAELRHPTLLAGLTMEREELYARIEARVDAMVAAGAERRGARRRRRGRLARRPPGARLRGAAGRRRRGDEGADPPLRQAPAHLAAQAAGGRAGRRHRPRAGDVAAELHAHVASRADPP